MNQKVLAGFLAGAVAASVITYFAGHRKTAAAPEVAAAVPAQVVAPVTPTPVAVTPELPPVASRKTAPKKVAKTEAAAPVAVERPAVGSPIDVATPTPPPAPPPPVAVAPASPEPPQPPPPPPAPAPASSPVVEPEPPHTVTIPNGTLLSVRLGETLSTKRTQSGDTFTATLDQPLVMDGFVIAERGARVDGRVIQAEQAGRVKGLARLEVELTRISTSDGQTVGIHTAGFEKIGPESKGEDAAKIGAGAVLGTILGAVAGGGKGAAIGAATGGAAGTGTVMATRGKPAELPVETRISFKIDRPVTITEHK